ncbi:MAG: ribonuclease Z [Anaerolineae bacterium]|nr:ribonuclease Z [Anaerolineae bacterium]MDH7475404.1 ribonuclease Z [Anaerolineae bacterium]
MAKLIILGTAPAFPEPSREYTYMILQGGESAILIDCASSPVQRLAQVGVNFQAVDHLIITHHHPDHMYGVPVFLLDLWLAGRQRPLHIYGPPGTARVIPLMMSLYQWHDWPGFYPIEFHEVEMTVDSLVLDSADFRITAAPAEHLVPTLALRVLCKETGGVAAYSSDTEPCEAVMYLAQGADLLIHESTGVHAGHSSSSAAGAIARFAGAKRLVLVHYPAQGIDVDRMCEEAEREFGGPVELAWDFASYEF